jgi:hypothetical protein
MVSIVTKKGRQEKQENAEEVWEVPYRAGAHAGQDVCLALTQGS